MLRAGPHNNFRSLLESPTTFLDIAQRLPTQHARQLNGAQISRRL
jgi:hypothetical protein